MAHQGQRGLRDAVRCAIHHAIHGRHRDHNSLLHQVRVLQEPNVVQQRSDEPRVLPIQQDEHRHPHLFADQAVKPRQVDHHLARAIEGGGMEAKVI